MPIYWLFRVEEESAEILRVACHRDLHGCLVSSPTMKLHCVLASLRARPAIGHGGHSADLAGDVGGGARVARPLEHLGRRAVLHQLAAVNPATDERILTHHTTGPRWPGEEILLHPTARCQRFSGTRRRKNGQELNGFAPRRLGEFNDAADGVSSRGEACPAVRNPCNCCEGGRRRRRPCGRPRRSSR